MIHYFDLISLFFHIFLLPVMRPIDINSPLFFIFMDEFRILSYLGFTYTTYITVKGDFIIIKILNISISKKSKIQNLKNKY
jgi:hypothetical protein